MLSKFRRTLLVMSLVSLLVIVLNLEALYTKTFATARRARITLKGLSHLESAVRELTYSVNSYLYSGETNWTDNTYGQVNDKEGAADLKATGEIYAARGKDRELAPLVENTSAFVVESINSMKRETTVAPLVENTSAFVVESINSMKSETTVAPPGGDSVRTFGVNVTASPMPSLEPFHRYFQNLSDESYYDPYIKVVMDGKSGCGNASSYDAVMAVHTAPDNEAKRRAFRWLYKDLDKTAPYRIQVLFFIGIVSDPALQSKLSNESKEFGDIVQGSFLDSYRNLTYKAIFSYKWLNEQCRGLRVLLRLDDDVFMDIHHFFQAWRDRVGAKSSTIMCDSVIYDHVRRHGKWRVYESEMAEEMYNFHHCMGYFAALSPDLVPKMDVAGRKTRFFWIDDVFVYGFVANKVGARFLNVYRETSRGKEKKFEECLQTQGRKCNLMAFVVGPEKFYEFYAYLNRTNAETQSGSSNLLQTRISTTGSVTRNDTSSGATKMSREKE